MEFTVHDNILDAIRSSQNIFLPLAGGTMSGAIFQPLPPLNNFHLTNKLYVDNAVLNATPDATSIVKGKVKLSGDLSGTADLPIVAPLAITNTKLANMTGLSQLKGSNGLSTQVTDILLGTGLSISGLTLNATGVLAPNAGNTQFGLVEFDSSGDLVETSANSGIAVIGASKVTNAKLNPGTNSTLKGTASGVVNDITLGTNLSMTGTTLNATIQNAGNAQFGLVEFDSSGDLVETSANSGIAVIGASKVTNAKLNPGTNSTLKGTASGVVNDITLGTNLSMTGTTLNATIQNAGNAQFGLVEFDSSGDLTQTSANSGIAVIGTSKVTNAKINPGTNSTLKGTASGVVNDITLGAGLLMSGTTLSTTTTVANLVQFTGGISYPTLTGIGTTAITYTAFSAYVRYTNLGSDVREVWSYPGGVYTPTWPDGASEQAVYVAFVPDYTTINTTKSLKIIEYSLYRSFPSDQIAEIVFYTIATRDTGTTFFTTFVSYMEGYYGTTYANKIKIFSQGSSLLLNTLGYRLKPETTNFGGAIGPYFNLAVGSAEVSGRNYLNDIFSTYVITADPAVQGASSTMTVTVAGRGTTGNEGQQFFRTTGSGAKILGTSTNIIYEPVNANSTADYVVVAATKWTYYKLVVFPGSRIIVVQPHNQGAFSSAATAIATPHIYDTVPYNTYDRWIPTIFVGYMALGGNFSLTSSWTANAGRYAFYDRNKVQYA